MKSTSNRGSSRRSLLWQGLLSFVFLHRLAGSSSRGINHGASHRHKPFKLPAPCPKKEWPVISMVKFNPIHLNMHRQGPVGTRASFITAQLLLLLCIAVYLCVHGRSPDLSWRRQGKMIGEQRDRQSNRAFKVASDSMRLWFFPLLFCLRGKSRAQL